MRPLAPVLAALLLSATPLSAQTQVVVITGLSGEARYAAAFHEWATTLLDAARERWGVPDSNIVYLAESTERAPDLITGRSTRENIEKELRELAARAQPDDQVLIVLIGHGNTRGDEARFNLPGPDMSAAEFDELLDAFADRKLAFINAASASGEFISTLSHENRAVVTATRSGRERNETLFPKFFVEAFASDDADVDKDGRVSLLEAFTYARREVVRSYQQDNRLLTEHALLDDNGDGVGSDEPDPTAADGSLAQSFYLAGGRALGAPGSGGRAIADPELARLYEEKQALEADVRELRARKDQIEPQAYERELEKLLVELALKNREIREREGKGG